MTRYERLLQERKRRVEEARVDPEDITDDAVEVDEMEEESNWSLRKLKAQTGKLEAETRAKELALEIQRGQFLPKAGIELWAQTVLTTFSASLQRVPKRLSSSLVGLSASQIQTRLEKELGRVVADLKSALENMECDDE